MKVSHVLYKTNNLDAAVAEFRDQGFAVEYGSKHRPHNALIYFSEGPYIEIINEAPLPFYLKGILRVIGKGKVVDRLEGWGKEEEGFFGFCLENHDTSFQREESILKKHQQKYFVTQSKRLDPSDRLLKWKILFPYELKLPFLMTYFNIDPKPLNFVHPNGIKQIGGVKFGTDANLISIIEDLCDDDILELQVGDGVQHVFYDRNES